MISPLSWMPIAVMISALAMRRSISC